MKLRLLVILSLIITVGCANLSTNHTADSRFIPVELWASANWSGLEDVSFSRLDTTSGKNGNRTVSGPITWRNPYTGKSYGVYEQVKTKKYGLKRQLFTLNEKGTALGRVFDSRPGSGDRVFENEAMFPVGYWRRGEERTFEYLVFLESGAVKRTATIKIRQLDYAYRGVEHSLKYDWIQRNEEGDVLFYERYVYSPGKGLVRFTDRMKEKA